MINKHFFKVLTVFSIMIIIGLLGVLLISYFGNDATGASELESVAN